MSTVPKATKSRFRFQFSLARLVFMSVMAGVLLFVNFRQNDNWYLQDGLGNYGLPCYTRPAEGYGWPYLVCGREKYGESVWWSWMGFCGNIVVSGAALFLSGVLFEVVCRWRRSKTPLRFNLREWLAIVACVSLVLALSYWPRNTNVPNIMGDLSRVSVHTVRGWPCAWYSVSIAWDVPPDFFTAANLPARMGFDRGEFLWTSLVLDLFIGALICGVFARFLIWLRRFRSSSPP